MRRKFVKIKNTTGIAILLLLWIFYGETFIFFTWKESENYCILPKLVYNTNLTDLIPEEKCKIKQNWGDVDKITHKWFFNENVKSTIQNINCKYRVINRIDDFNIQKRNFKVLEEGVEILDEVFEVECTGLDKNSTTNFNNLYVQLVDYEKKEITQNNLNNDRCSSYDIILLSYDSVSRVSFVERLKKTFDLINKSENFFVLNGYNIVGDGTPPGKTEEELPSTLKNDPNGKYVDEVYPFIWKELHHKNYTSIYLDDWPHIGAFTYRMRGFKNHTTKHYPKHYQLRLNQMKIEKRKLYKNDDFCMGDTKRHKILLNLLTDFKNLYNKKKSNIAFMHYVENSHDSISHLHWLDNDIYEFLTNGLKTGIFDNTVLFLYSDHGARFNQQRSSQRYLEERLPFFSIYLPDKFIKNNYQKVQNFKKNTNLLTSPFDIHETVRDLTCLNRKKTSDRHRSISLFDKISKFRSCEDIGIAEHFCTCVKDWKKVNSNSDYIQKVVDFALKSLNSITYSKRNICQLLNIIEVISVEKYSQGIVNLYRVSFITTPNNGIYETIVYEGQFKNFEFRSENFSVKTRNDISRIDSYGEQPWCVANFGSNPGLLLDLRKFCFCFPKTRTTIKTHKKIV